MAEYSIGDALRRFVRESGWGEKALEYQLKAQWETIAGKTIARYTSQLQIKNKILYLRTEIAPLKQELQLNKESLIQKINQHFEETLILDLKIL